METVNLSWHGIEEVKDMIFFSSKYKTGVVVSGCPHLIFFANEPPQWHLLSADRWKIWTIKDNDLVPWNPEEE